MKPAIAIIWAVGVAAVSTGSAGAQMMNWWNFGVSDEMREHTIREEAEGNELWKKFQGNQISCADLTDSSFGVLGEYFMGLTTGDSHAAMNVMIVRAHGEDGEEQIHVAMGKRISGCDASAAFPAALDWMSMMRGGLSSGRAGWSSPFGFNSISDMMNFGYGFGPFGWIFMVFWWVVIIAAAVLLVRWSAGWLKGGDSGKSALDILKERYARGEINKEEFEEKKRELAG